MFKGFLLKALIISGAGGGPIVFFGLTSTNTEEKRQFRWSINLDQDNTLEAKKEGGYWLEGLKKEKWQGINAGEWEKLSGTTGRSVYKLAFRSFWAQEASKNAGEKSAKGALSLIKASWGAGNSKELKVEEINVGDDRKVWLIIAKSETSIYLIPVVRSSTRREDSGNRWWEESDATKKNWREGVEDIGAWTTKFDKQIGWEEARNESLQKQYKSGLWIRRVGGLVSEIRGEVQEIRRENSQKVCYIGGKKQTSGCEGMSGGVKMYQNAGRMSGMGIGRCRECKWKEEYFPLDISVLGDSTKLKDTTKAPESLIQEIEIKDNITQVVGVRLDQVVINETGIGDGKENQISWGNVPKPSLIRELLK